jgi:hypothetical protein
MPQLGVQSAGGQRPAELCQGQHNDQELCIDVRMCVGPWLAALSTDGNAVMGADLLVKRIVTGLCYACRLSMRGSALRPGVRPRPHVGQHMRRAVRRLLVLHAGRLHLQRPGFCIPMTRLSHFLSTDSQRRIATCCWANGRVDLSHAAVAGHVYANHGRHVVSGRYLTSHSHPSRPMC